MRARGTMLKEPESTSPKKEGLDEERNILRSPFSILHFALFLAVACIGLTADLWTKQVAFDQLGLPGMYRWEEEPALHATYWVWKDVFGFQTSLNEGALFGMGQGQSALFAVLSGVALLGILGWILHSAWKSRFLVLTLGMIVAGILGNCYDRLGMHRLLWHYADKHHEIGEPVYAVRDWILVMIGSYHWPNFNIADSLLVCGAILIVLYSFFVQDDQTNRAEKKPEEEANE